MAIYSIDTNAKPQPTPPSRWRSWRLIACCAGAVIAAGVGVGMYMMRTPEPPPPTADPKAVVEYAASKEFANLKPEEKKSLVSAITQDARKFIDAARNSGMSDDQRRDALRNIFIARAQQHVDAYYALPPGPQRAKYMDSVIDEVEQRRSEMQAMRPEGAANAAGPNAPAGGPPGMGGGPMQGVNAERIKSMMESIPPEQRARFAEFRKVMSDRRKEKGLPEMGRP